MMCQRIGRPPIGTMGFGMLGAASAIRRPAPPQKMTTFIRKFPRSGMDDHLRNRHDEPRTPLPGEGELLDDLVLEVPRKDEDEVWSVLRNLARMRYRYVRAGQKTVLLVRVSVDGVVHEIGSNPTVVQKGVSLPGSSIAGD